jgi:hypothetical protein
VDAKRRLPEAEAYLSEAVADVGAALADVAVAMQRAVEKIEDMKSRASVFERHHNAGTFDGQRSVVAIAHHRPYTGRPLTPTRRRPDRLGRWPGSAAGKAGVSAGPHTVLRPPQLAFGWIRGAGSRPLFQAGMWAKLSGCGPVRPASPLSSAVIFAMSSASS